tara:strand:- start:111 stop:353 length:243 start_codon:yes stop_codon:yes gene_type:complete
MNTLKIESEDIYNKWVQYWVTIHSVYINDEFIGKSSNARDVLDDNEVDIKNLKVDDDHTKSVLDGTYKSEWIQERNSYNN